jgi:two-component system, NarL family, nitrate/nitrite response regulator NarL
MPEKLRVVVVDDHPLYRSGVVGSLREDGEFEVVGEGASADEALELCRVLRPDIVLLDISMPGNGVDAARRIAVESSDPNIVMLTASEAEDDIMKALAAGARGYIVKGIGAGDFISALRSICSGESYVSPGLAARLLVSMRTPAEKSPESAFDTLTIREEQILKQVANGLSNKEVGRKLDLQEKTVKHYMTTILQKLHVRNRVEAALKAREKWN